MSEKTIRGMRKSELVALLEGSIVNINEIDRRYKEIVEIKNKLDRGNYLENIQNAHTESVKTSSEIADIHKEIFDGDEENGSIESEIDSLRTKWKESNKKLVELKKEVFGYSTTNDRGEKIEHKGYIDKIKENLDEHDKKYRESLRQN